MAGDFDTSNQVLHVNGPWMVDQLEWSYFLGRDAVALKVEESYLNAVFERLNRSDFQVLSVALHPAPTSPNYPEFLIVGVRKPPIHRLEALVASLTAALQSR